MDESIIAVIVLAVAFVLPIFFSARYLFTQEKKVKKGEQEKQEEKAKQKENLKLKQEHAQKRAWIQEKIMSSGIIERCSEIIDAYCKLSAIDFFDMSVGNIWVVIPKPQYIQLMGKMYSPSQDIEIIFDTYYDCSIFPDMLSKGVQSLISWGVPQVLVDRNVSVFLDSDHFKVKWIVKTYSPAELYGYCDANSFNSMFEMIQSMLKNKYSNLKTKYPDINLIVTP